MKVNTMINRSYNEEGYVINVYNMNTPKWHDTLTPYIQYANTIQRIITNDIDEQISTSFDSFGLPERIIYKSMGGIIHKTKLREIKDTHIIDIYDLNNNHTYGPTLLDISPSEYRLNDIKKYVCILDERGQEIFSDRLDYSKLGDTEYVFDSKNRIIKKEYCSGVKTEYEYFPKEDYTIPVEIFGFYSRNLDIEYGEYKAVVEVYENDECIMNIRNVVQIIRPNNARKGWNLDISANIDDNGKYINPYIKDGEYCIKIFKKDMLILVLPYKVYVKRYLIKGLVKNDRVIDFEYAGRDYEVIYK